MLFMQHNSFQFQNQGIHLGMCSIHHQPAKFIQSANSKSFYLCDVCLMLHQQELQQVQPKLSQNKVMNISCQYQSQDQDIIDQFRKQIQMELLSPKERNEDIIEVVKERAGLLQTQNLKGIDITELQNYDLNQLRNQFLIDQLQQNQQQLNSQAQITKKQFNQKQPLLKSPHPQEINQIAQANTALNDLTINSIKNDTKNQQQVLYAQIKDIKDQSFLAQQNQIKIFANTQQSLLTQQGTKEKNSLQNQILGKQTLLVQENQFQNLNDVIQNQNHNLCENIQKIQSTSLLNQLDVKYLTFSQSSSNCGQQQKNLNLKSTIQQDDQKTDQIIQRSNILLINQINQNPQISLQNSQSTKNIEENNLYRALFPIEPIVEQDKDIRIKLEEESKIQNIRSSQMLSEKIQPPKTLKIRCNEFAQDITLDIQKINQNGALKGSSMEEENSFSVTHSFSVLSNGKSEKSISSSPFPIQKKIRKQKSERDVQKEVFLKNHDSKQTPSSIAVLSQLSSLNNIEVNAEENPFSCGKSVSSNFFQYGNNMLNVKSTTRLVCNTEASHDQAETTQINPSETLLKQLSHNSPLKLTNQNIIQQAQLSQKQKQTEQQFDEKFYFIQQNQVLYQNFSSNQLYQVELSVRKNESNKLKSIKKDIPRGVHIVPVNELIFAMVQETNLNNLFAFQIDSFELSQPERPFKTQTIKTQFSSQSFKLLGVESIPTAGKLILYAKDSIIFYDLFTEKYEYKSIDAGNGEQQDIVKIKYVLQYPRHSVVVMTKQKYFFIFDISKNYKLTIQRIGKEDNLINQDQIVDFWYYEDKRFCCDSKNIYEILKQKSLTNPQQKIQLLTLNLSVKNANFFSGSSLNGLVISLNNQLKYFRFHDKNLISIPSIASASKDQFLFEINNQVYKCSH
ncbi:hypothetical protein TTHERM_00678000 (macronuclear) [Tetrahymena thermophila SB210]|uniref:Uncharacterized protein n=1 Tax=Tetrahymena thermophila (strain SB210) TaxID=312017 RepID=I7MMY7_TETTS|nr:hypothetical protein TTHERM_00678000 [Tetrahymena thermophila SB210]EAS07534.2 hypothetical protein TTHERM_00678000 [Tetrahymena thermophila SB210]|eukprot:XP_001027776.2 hypothetical protein TTHERM_00678000 [Tetrahymena thermophila SB210]